MIAVTWFESIADYEEGMFALLGAFTKSLLKMSKKLPAVTLKLHTNAHIVLRDRPTLKDGDERTFRSRSFRDASSKVKPVITRFSLDHVDRKKNHK